jgi:transposase
MNINGAVDIESLDVVTRSCDRVNTSSICELLRAIRAKNPSGELIRLIMDNGAYNHALKVKELAKELGIELAPPILAEPESDRATLEVLQEKSSLQ